MIHLSAGPLAATILPLGAILQSFTLDGRPLTVGSNDLSRYEGDYRYHGSIVAPVVNRIARPWGEPPNEGRVVLHSGRAGTHLKVWDVVEEEPDAVTLRVAMPDGEGGFPGHRRLTARYSLTPDRLRLDLTGTTDTDTPFAPAHHPYWNLTGGETWEGHSLRVAADRYLPATAELIPTGEIADVAGTPYDFRQTRALARREPMLDTNFCLSETDQPMREVAWLSAGGVTLAVATTAPGLQVYDDSKGAPPWGGIALEPQAWPGALDQPHFPPITLRAGGTWRQSSEYRISRTGG